MAKQKTKVCPNCSKELAKSALSCPDCGKTFKKPFFKRKWVWLLIALVTIAAVTISIVVSCTEAVFGDPDVVSTVEYGQTATVNGVNYKVNGVSKGEVITKDSLFGSVYTATGIYMLIDLEFMNTNNTETVISDIYLYVGETKYSPTTPSILEDFFWLSLTLAPGLTKSTTVVFDVPKDTDLDQAQIQVASSIKAARSKLAGAVIKQLPPLRTDIEFGEQGVFTGVLEFTVLSVEETQEIPGGIYNDYVAQGKFLIVEVSLENISTESFDINGWDDINAKLLVGKTVYEPESIYISGYGLSVTLSPRIPNTHKFVFDVPSDTSLSDAGIRFRYGSEGRYIVSGLVE